MPLPKAAPNSEHLKDPKTPGCELALVRQERITPRVGGLFNRNDAGVWRSSFVHVLGDEVQGSSASWRTLQEFWTQNQLFVNDI